MAALVPTAPAAARTSSEFRMTAAPYGDYVTRLTFDVATISPTLVTATGPTTLTITGTMTNTGPDELVNLSYRVQRGDALRTTADVHQEIAEPSEPAAVIPSTFTDLSQALPAGSSAPFEFTATLTGPTSLDLTRPGVYPVMVNVNGGVVLEAGPLEARIGELHLLLTVMGVPGSTPTPESTTPPTGQPTPFNFVWPLVDEPHLGVDGVFLNDDLLTDISPGGRLAVLLDGLTGEAARELPAGALTVAMDPQLLDELDRMTGPYLVVATPGDPQPPVTAIAEAQDAPTTAAATTEATPTPATSAPPAPSSTAGTPTETVPGAGGSVDIPGTVTGTGQAAAASYLERLRALAEDHPVVLLPYGDPDVVALVRAGMTAEVATAQEQGREVARRVFGDLATATSTTAFPIDGAADGSTLSTLMSGGARTGLLSQASVDVPIGDDGRPAASALIRPDRADPPTGLPTVVAQTDVLGGLDRLIDDEQPAGWATKVNSLTALLAQQRADGTTAPAVFAPVRRWSPDTATLNELVGLLGDLGRSGVITGTTLARLSTAPKQTGVTDYPEAARDQELAPEYLSRLSTDRAAVADLRAALTSVTQQSDPATVLDPLDEAIDTAASTAFRTDPTVGQANLSTVESTVSGIRSGVQIASAGNSYTLASSTSPLVLTVQNSTPYDVPVIVQLTGGEMVGLTVTDQPVQIIPAGRSQQVRIQTEVTRSGQFQVTATLVGTDGIAWGSPVQLSVESSAYGALAVILMAVAGGVLVVMVALRIRQRWRGRQARIAAAAHERGAGSGGDPRREPSGARPAADDAKGPDPDRRLVPGSPHRPQSRQDYPS
jgi:hypothetical protein